MRAVCIRGSKTNSSPKSYRSPTGSRTSEEEEAGEGAGEGGVDEAANREIKTCIPFGIQVVLLRNRGISVVLRH